MIDIKNLDPTKLGFDHQLASAYGDGYHKELVANVELNYSIGGEVTFTVLNDGLDVYHGTVETFNKIKRR